MTKRGFQTHTALVACVCAIIATRASTVHASENETVDAVLGAIAGASEVMLAREIEGQPASESESKSTEAGLVMRSSAKAWFPDPTKNIDVKITADRIAYTEVVVHVTITSSSVRGEGGVSVYTPAVRADVPSPTFKDPNRTREVEIKSETKLASSDWKARAQAECNISLKLGVKRHAGSIQFASEIVGTSVDVRNIEFDEIGEVGGLNAKVIGAGLTKVFEGAIEKAEKKAADVLRDKLQVLLEKNTERLNDRLKAFIPPPLLIEPQADIDGPEAPGRPSQLAMTVDPKTNIFYWTTPAGYLRRGKINGQGMLEAMEPHIDTPENGKPSQVRMAAYDNWIYWTTNSGHLKRAQVKDHELYRVQTLDEPEPSGPFKGKCSQQCIAVDDSEIWWVAANGDLRRGRLNRDNKLEAVGPPVDSAEESGPYKGSPSQQRLFVRGDSIFWTTPEGVLRKGKVNKEGRLETTGSALDTPERPGVSSQREFAVVDNVLYWITPDGRFRRGKIIDE